MKNVFRIIVIIFCIIETNICLSDSNRVDNILNELKTEGPYASTLLKYSISILTLTDKEFIELCNKVPEYLFDEAMLKDGAGETLCGFLLGIRGAGLKRYVNEISKKTNHIAFRWALIEIYSWRSFNYKKPLGTNKIREMVITKIMQIFKDKNENPILREIAYQNAEVERLISLVLNKHKRLKEEIEKKEHINDIEADPSTMAAIKERASYDKTCPTDELKRRLEITEKSQKVYAQQKAFLALDLFKYNLPDDVCRAENIRRDFLRTLFETALNPKEDIDILMSVNVRIIDIAHNGKHFFYKDAKETLDKIMKNIDKYPKEVQIQVKDLDTMR